MRKVVLASRNEDKVRELKQLFDGLDFEVVSTDNYPGLPDIIEDGTTMVGNARRKAIITAAYTGEISVADDTSLEVRKLNGFPDIFAARFSGEGATYDSNAQLVLDLMQDVPDDVRQARFGTACAWVDPRPESEDALVLAPAHQRWLRNPWSQVRAFQLADGEWDYWNSLVDRRAVWQAYRQGMESQPVSWGVDHDRLMQISRDLFAGCEDALLPGEKLNQALVEEGMRLPDTRIWSVSGPDEEGEGITPFAPSGLPQDAPGRELCGKFWLEITTEGKILGNITRQKMGAMGFGYDPVFQPVGESRTLAELPTAEKNAISHRGKAMRRLTRAVSRVY